AKLLSERLPSARRIDVLILSCIDLGRAHADSMSSRIPNDDFTLDQECQESASEVLLDLIAIGSIDLGPKAWRLEPRIELALELGLKDPMSVHHCGGRLEATTAGGEDDREGDASDQPGPSRKRRHARDYRNALRHRSRPF